MVIKHEQLENAVDIEVYITYPQKTTFVKRLLNLIKSADTQLICQSNGNVKIVNSSEIDYIESIDKKSFIYCEKNGYPIKEPLYKIYEKLKHIGFIQINKYCVLNLNRLKNIKQLPNSHLEAVLKNGTQLYVTRKYLNNLKNILMEKQ